MQNATTQDKMEKNTVLKRKKKKKKKKKKKQKETTDGDDVGVKEDQA